MVIVVRAARVKGDRRRENKFDGRSCRRLDRDYVLIPAGAIVGPAGMLRPQARTKCNVTCDPVRDIREVAARSTLQASFSHFRPWAMQSKKKLISAHGDDHSAARRDA